MRKPPSELLPDDDDNDDDNDQPNPNQSEPHRELGFKIQILQQHDVKADNNKKIINEEEAATSIEVYIRWIWGLDSALFESFYGMLRKNIFSCNLI